MTEEKLNQGNSVYMEIKSLENTIEKIEKNKTKYSVSEVCKELYPYDTDESIIAYLKDFATTKLEALKAEFEEI